MNNPGRAVALLFGGESSEHEVSISSAAQVAAALDLLQGTRTVPVYVTKEGKWQWSRPAPGISAADLVRATRNPEDLTRHYQPNCLEFAQGLFHLTVDNFESVFIALHGTNGEDGRLQGALDLAGIRYTGSGPAASALAFDKPRCQSLLAGLGMPIPRFVALDRRISPEELAPEAIASQVGLPCVIKPALGGSSVGVSIVEKPEQFAAALASAFEHGPIIHAEKFIQGREFTCGVIEGDRAEALPVTEIIPPEGRFFDYEAKYEAGVSTEITPAEIEDSVAKKVQSLTLEVHKAIGCDGFSRVDFMLDGEDLMILEINTIPGLTETSLLPQGLAAAGIELSDFVDRMLLRAKTRSAWAQLGAACNV